MILFLDFDGVLHPFPMPADAAQLFCHLPRLEAVLRDFPEVQIVISSSWRESHSLAELAALFSPDIASRIIGVLPVIEIGSLADTVAVRHREIELFLAAQGEPTPWLALDDDSALFSPGCPQLVQCREGFGLAEEQALRNRLMQIQRMGKLRLKGSAMSTWNYRVIEFDATAEHQEPAWRAIHEVYYDKDGRPEGYAQNPAVIGWCVDEGDAAPLAMLERMREALTKPVLVESDFHHESPNSPIITPAKDL